MEDPRLHDETLHLPALPPQYDPERLKIVFSHYGVSEREGEGEREGRGEVKESECREGDGGRQRERERGREGGGKERK